MSSATVKAEHIGGIQKQTLVQITIQNNEIFLYPQRETDAVVYRKDQGKGHPAKPEQIRWVAEGLGANQRLLIEGKLGQANLFPRSPFEIKGGDNTVLSGPPAKDAANGARWRYNIFLYEGEDPNPIAMKDPGIEIKDDP